jgi:hypothetical protein
MEPPCDLQDAVKVTRPEIEAGMVANLESVYSSDEYQSLTTLIDVLEISCIQDQCTTSWDQGLDHDSLLMRLQVSLYVLLRLFISS